MDSEQDTTLKALQTAIRMEIDGKTFYLKASQQSQNELGRKLLETLAAEEDVHRQKFEEIFAALSDRQGWPPVEFHADGGSHLRTIFARALENIEKQPAASDNELDAITQAMQMENRSADFYEARRGKATSAAERGFFEALTMQEREHHRILADYYEYLKDPAAWFVEKEHPSLDAG